MPRRGTDRIEDIVVWLLASAGMVLAVLAVFAGTAAHAQVAERRQLEL